MTGESSPAHFECIPLVQIRDRIVNRFITWQILLLLLLDLQLCGQRQFGLLVVLNLANQRRQYALVELLFQVLLDLDDVQ